MQESAPSLVASALSKSPWFSSLTPEELNQLASLATWLPLGPDAVVFREGDPGDALFVVVTGLVRILVATKSGEILLNTLGPGDIFGEIAVLDGRGRTATVTTRRGTELVKIGRQEFLAFLEDFPRYTTVLVHNIGIARPQHRPGLSRRERTYSQLTRRRRYFHRVHRSPAPAQSGIAGRAPR
jgi:CRP-like cAMP-binding protein